jgi:flagellar biogenesis protein FliO
MDLLSLLRTLGGLGVVLGVLGGALWVVRRYDLRLPGRTIRGLDRRLELVETLSIDARRMVALVRRDGREHVILIAPEGHLILESAIVRDAAELAADEARREAHAEAEALREQHRAWQHELRAAATKMAAARLLTNAKRLIGNAVRIAQIRGAPEELSFDPPPEPPLEPATAQPAPRRRQTREKQVA